MPASKTTELVESRLDFAQSKVDSSSRQLASCRSLAFRRTTAQTRTGKSAPSARRKRRLSAKDATEPEHARDVLVQLAAAGERPSARSPGAASAGLVNSSRSAPARDAPAAQRSTACPPHDVEGVGDRDAVEAERCAAARRSSARATPGDGAERR